MGEIDTSTKAVKALMDGVTEGPWVFGHDPEDASNPKISIHLPGGEYYIAQVDEGHEQEANARFIAAARNLVPALLAERDDLRGKLNAMPAAEVAPHDPAKVQALVEAAEKMLNFIQNTESEMGVILGCGDKARAALAAMKEG